MSQQYKKTFILLTYWSLNAKYIVQAGAELCRAQAQQGYHAEATTKQTLDYKSWNLFWAL